MSATSLGLVHQRAEVDAVLQVVPTLADEVLAFRDVLVEVLKEISISLSLVFSLVFIVYVFVYGLITYAYFTNTDLPTG